MKPVKLKLRNFMCYRDTAPPLLFEGIHVVCLCGENGAGKSALLDAITWALWGETSRTRTDDDLVHTGRSEMEVELEFQVRDTLYRVVRKRECSSPRRAGRTTLELHVSTGDRFVPLTGNSRKDTERKIIEVLRMDFETFINSAFLVQGRADEFTTKSPHERKTVLQEILNLREYDALEGDAKEAAKARRDEGVVLDAAIQDLERHLQRREEYLQREKDVQAALGSKREELTRRDADAQRLRAATQALEQKQAQAATVRQRLAQLDGEILRLRQRSEAMRKEIARDEAAIADAEAIAAEHSRFLEIAARKEAMDAGAAAYLRASQQRARLEQAVARARADLEKEQVRLAARVQDLLARASLREATSREIAECEAAIRELQGVEARVQEDRASVQDLAAATSALESENKGLRATMEEIKRRMEQIRGGEGVCPLCGTALGQDRCASVLGQYQEEGEEKAASYRENAARIAQLKQQKTQAEKALAAAEARIKAGQAVHQPKLGFLLHRLEEASAAAADLPAVQERLEETERRVRDGLYAVEEHRALAAVSTAIAGLGYEEEAHTRLRVEYEKRRPIEARFRLLEDAQRRLPLSKELQAEHEKDIAQREAAAGQDRAALAALAQELGDLPKLRAALTQEDAACRSLGADVERLQQELGAARQDLARLQEAERLRAEKAIARATAADEQSIYEELALAFSRKGIQALIIESAIPEIEEEANELLARMTDHRMSLKLETQVAYKSKEGELKETLEIRIGDELGTRSYEMFSGGEAFRVNLALRIALSRLLAKRAGAPLPTLFIDEGFGTQDMAGRDKLVEAITSIQDQFERIIVITHIDELKEQFPNRIEVAKTADGSAFWLA